MPQPTLILGSSSKTRAQILKTNNILFTTLSPNIDEKSVGDRQGDPSLLALQIALAKSSTLLSKISSNPHYTDSRCVLLTCDQVVSWGDGGSTGREVREKPTSAKECKAFLKSYTVQPATTHSALVMVDLFTGKRVEGVLIARQGFHVIPDCVVEAIIEQGDIMHCAGGLIIDIDLITPYLAERTGAEDSILGLPMDLFHELLANLTE